MMTGRPTGRIAALAALTARESLRQPMALMLTTLAALLAALFPLLVVHQFGDEGRMVRDSVLALQFSLGMYLASACASAAVSGEMRSGTALLVLSKNVSRASFFLAKYLGVAAVVLFFSLCIGLAASLASRVGPGLYVVDGQAAAVVVAAVCVAYAAAGLANFVRGVPFTSSAHLFLVAMLVAALVALECRPGAPDAMPLRSVLLQIGPPVLLIAFALLIMAALALALASRLRPAPVLALCGALFLGGLASDYLCARLQAVPPVAAALRAILPDWQHVWVTDALANGGRVPAAYVLRAGAYALLYVAGVLGLGAAAFAGREMK